MLVGTEKGIKEMDLGIYGTTLLGNLFPQTLFFVIRSLIAAGQHAGRQPVLNWVGPRIT